MKKKFPLTCWAVSSILFGATSAQAADYTITLKDHVFTPASLTIPAQQRIKLVVKNLGDEPGEFESSDFNREKLIPANGEVMVFIGPLDAGTYHYFDDFNRAATGTILVK